MSELLPDVALVVKYYCSHQTSKLFLKYEHQSELSSQIYNINVIVYINGKILEWVGDTGCGVFSCFSSVGK